MADISLFSDTFHRADESPLNPARWLNVLPPAGGGPLPLSVVAQFCTVPVGGGIGVESPIIAGPAPTGTWPIAQYSKITINSFTSGGSFDLYAIIDTNFHGYYGDLSLQGIGRNQPQVQIFRIDGFGTTTLIAGPVLLVAPFAPGDSFYYSLDGKNHIIEYNGVNVLSVVETTYTSGFFPALLITEPDTISYYEAGIQQHTGHALSRLDSGSQFGTRISSPNTAMIGTNSGTKIK